MTSNNIKYPFDILMSWNPSEKISLKELFSWNPCEDYKDENQQPTKKLLSLLNGKKYFTLKDLHECKIPYEHKKWVYEKIAKQGREELQLEASRNPDSNYRKVVAEHCGKNILSSLAHDVSEDVRIVVAIRGDDEIHLKMVEDCARSYDFNVFDIIATNSYNKAVLMRLAHNQDDRIRRLVAYNTAYEFSEILTKLASDPEQDVRAVVVSSVTGGYHTTQEFQKIQMILTKDPDTYIRRRLAYGTKEEEIHMVLSSDPDPQVRRSVARYGNINVRMKMAEDPDEEVRHILKKVGNAELTKKIKEFEYRSASLLRKCIMLIKDKITNK